MIEPEVTDKIEAIDKMKRDVINCQNKANQIKTLPEILTELNRAGPYNASQNNGVRSEYTCLNFGKDLFCCGICFFPVTEGEPLSPTNSSTTLTNNT